MKITRFRIFRRPEPKPLGDGVTPEPAEVRLRTILLAVFLIVGPPILLALYLRSMYGGLMNTDALDFAQLGRNISAGRGFTTYLLRPLTIDETLSPIRQPDATHSPLYPFLLALAFGVAGARDIVVIAVSGLFYILTIPATYFLGLRMFNRTIGVFAALVYIFNALILEYAAAGLHVTLYIFLMTCALLVLYNLASYEIAHVGQPVVALPKTQLMALGGLASLLYLTEPVFAWVIPVFTVYTLWLCRSRWWRALGWFTLPIIILVVPWMIRNHVVSGNAVFALRGLEMVMNTETYERGLTYRYTIDEITPGLQMVYEVIFKLLRSAGQVIQTYPTITSSWLLAFFLPALLFRLTNTASAVVRSCMLACGLALMWGTILFAIDMMLFVALIPTALIFSLAYLVHLAGEAQLSRPSMGLVATLVTLVVLLPLVYDTQLSGSGKTGVQEADSARALAKITQQSDVCFSDSPWIVAWYADRAAIWLPRVDGNVAYYRKKFPRAQWLFLTEASRAYSEGWRSIYDGFHRWSVLYNRATESKRPVPQRPRITGKGHPLLEGLSGFTGIEPGVKGTPTAIIAAYVPDRTGFAWPVRVRRLVARDGPVTGS